MSKITPETKLKRQCIEYLRWKKVFNFPILQGLGVYAPIFLPCAEVCTIIKLIGSDHRLTKPEKNLTEAR